MTADITTTSCTVIRAPGLLRNLGRNEFDFFRAPSAIFQAVVFMSRSRWKLPEPIRSEVKFRAALNPQKATDHRAARRPSAVPASAGVAALKPCFWIKPTPILTTPPLPHTTL